MIVPLAENEGCWEVDSCGTGIREHLLEVLNYERWDGSNKGTSLRQKSVPKGEELETTTVDESKDEDALGVGRPTPTN